MNDQCKHCDKKNCNMKCTRVPLYKYGKPMKMIEKDYMTMLKWLYNENLSKIKYN